MVPVFWIWPLRTPPDTKVIWVASLKAARQTLELVSFLNVTGLLPLPSSIEIESIWLLNRSSICQFKSRFFTRLTASWTYTFKSKFNFLDLFSTALPVSSKSVGFNSSGVIFTCLILRAVSLSFSVTLPKCLGSEYSFNPIIVERELVSVLLSLEPLLFCFIPFKPTSDKSEPPLSELPELI